MVNQQNLIPQQHIYKKIILNGQKRQTEARTMKKILFITGYFPFHQGGAEYQALMLADRLKSTSNISFIFRNHWGKKNIIQDMGYTLYGIKPSPMKRITGSVVFEASQLYRVLEKVNPNIIYIRGTSAYFMIATYYAKKKHCKIIWHIAHDNDITPLNNKIFFTNPFLFINKKMVEFGIKNCNCIVGQTNYQSKQLLLNYKKECNLIVGNWHPVPEARIKKNKEIIVLWIANWKPIKQPEIFIQLVKSIKNFPNVNPNVKYIMIGRNDSYSTLIKKAESNKIIVTGEISNLKVNELLSKSHILINTSLKEGFSNTFIQAWMNTVPVISLHVDPDHILKQKKIGLLSGNFHQLVIDTQKMICDHKFRNCIGENARKHAIQYHSLSNLDDLVKNPTCIF